MYSSRIHNGLVALTEHFYAVDGTSRWLLDETGLLHYMDTMHAA